MAGCSSEFRRTCRERSIRLVRGDYLDAMRGIADGSVDLVLCDLPYGVTRCEWDRKIPLEPLWEQYERVTRDRSAIALFAQQPFATELAAGRPKWLRYDWVWDKGRATGFANARRMPMRRHENVLIFYRRLPQYNPQGLRPCRPRTLARRTSEVYSAVGRDGYQPETAMTGYPQSVVRFDRERGAVACQKPVELLEYLIRTYTSVGETVLDNAMGTGSTGVAAARAGRNFIGIEIDPERFCVAEARIDEAFRMGKAMPEADAGSVATGTTLGPGQPRRHNRDRGGVGVRATDRACGVRGVSEVARG